MPTAGTCYEQAAAAGPQATPNVGDVANAHKWNGYRWMPMKRRPGLAYALTRQTSDDLIARFAKVMIWVQIVTAAAGLAMAGFGLFMMMSMMASLASIIAR